MRKIATIAGSIVGANIALYLGWARTAEGKFCRKVVRRELNAYRAMKRDEQRIRNLEVTDARPTPSASR